MHPVLPRPLDELSELRGRVEALARELEDVRVRLDGIDAPRPDDALTPPSPVAAVPAPVERGGFGEVLALVGRACLVLGGGFLVRAFTETGALSSAVGVACGFVYAMALVAWAVKGARHGRPREGLADGVAAALIVFPLVWEAAGRFGVLTGAGPAVALAVAAHALLAAAAASALPALAWVAALGAVGTACLLLPATHALVPLTAAVIVLAFTTRALARARAWAGLGWPALAGGALLVGAGVFVATAEGGIPATFASLRPAHVVALALGLPVAVLLASAVPRRDRQEMPVSGVVQVAVSVAVGYAGALRVASASAFAQRPLALFGVASAAAALAWGETRRPRQPVHADASSLVALAVGLFASVQLLGPAGRVASCLAAGVALCVTFRSAVLAWTGAVLLALAAMQAGVVTGVLRGLSGAPPRGAAALTLAAAVLAAALASRRALARVGRTAALRDALAVLALPPLALLALAAAVTPVADDAARCATAATAVLAGTAFVLATMVRLGRPFGPRWVPYAALAASGAKLVLFDLRLGRPATLFVAFAFYGASLIFTSRALRGEKTPRP